jgi:hypothetical protein
LRKGTEESHETSQSKYPVSEPRFERGILRSRCANHWTATCGVLFPQGDKQVSCLCERTDRTESEGRKQTSGGITSNQAKIRNGYLPNASLFKSDSGIRASKF